MNHGEPQRSSFPRQNAVTLKSSRGTGAQIRRVSRTLHWPGWHW